MNKAEFVKSFSAKLDDKKPQFLADVRTEVADYIAAQGNGCLTLIESAGRTDWIWKLSLHPDYVARLITFCRNRAYDGNPLDSALTKPIVKIVTAQFEKLYAESSDEIARDVMRFIVQDKVLAATVANTLLDSARLPASAIRNRAASLVVEQLRAFLQTSTGHTVTNFVGKTVAATVSKPVGMHLAVVLVNSLSVQLKGVIARVLASAALKSAVATAVKKFLIFAVAGAVIKWMAIQLGISSSMAFTIVLIPVVVGYLIYELVTLPENLAEKVSCQIVEDLSGKYAEVNAEVLENVIAQIIETGIAVIVRPVADSPEVQSAISEMLRELK